MKLGLARFERETSRLAIAASFALMTFGTAAAQDQPAAPTPSPAMEEIVVTGSRVAHTNLEATVPVVSITGATLQDKGIPNLADSLNELPQLGAATLTNTRGNFSDDDSGISTINLRNLGEARTLVLIDGRRTVSGVPIGQGDPGYAVDISMIPTYLIDHVDIVTGGGSASYGSEAVAGVVNIVLKDHYDGVMVNQQYGLTSYGDSKTEAFDLIGGTDFLDGRGHFVGGLDFQDQGAVYSKDRSISAMDIQNGNYTPSSYTVYGTFGTSKGNYEVLPDGSVAKYSAATYGFDRNPLRTIQIPTDHISLYERTSYDITSDITAFVDASFARQTATAQLEPIAIGPAVTTIGFTGQTLALPINNAFVPPALAALGIVNDGNGNFADFRRRMIELGDRGNDSTHTIFTVVAGFKGNLLDRFSWDVDYSYGESDRLQQGRSGNVLNLQNALYTTVINGQIVCADPVARSQGCVPVDLFGPGKISPAAVAYISAPKTYTDQNRQTIFDANINGPVYTLPYGDIRVAAGFEYRREDAYMRPDALTSSGYSLDTQQPPSSGGYDIREYYVEAIVPLLSDVPYAKNLSIEGSYRYSDYSTIGGENSYRYGLSYAPIEDIKFRVVNSVAIRAPNLNDLYAGRSQNALSVTDPCSGVGIASAVSPALRAANCAKFPGVVPGFTEQPFAQQAEISYQEGNPDLQAERAKVLTYGVVFQPRWLPRFATTIDFFSYKIQNSIQSIDTQTAADECADTLLSNFCDLVRRDTNPASPTYGLIQGVDQKVINVGNQIERGIDVTVSYGFQIGDVTDALFGQDYDAGKLDMSWNYEFIQGFQYMTLPNVVTEQRGLFGVPHNKWNLNLLYTKDALEVNYGIRYIGSQDFAIGGTLGPSIDPFLYNDLSIRYHVTDDITGYVGVNNIFDVKPPLVDQGFQQTGAGVTYAITGTNTVPQVYDAIGRFIYFGVNWKFGG